MKALLIALMFVAVAHAEEPATSEDFFDEKLLTQAEREVAEMTPDQLNAFIEYIAQCRVLVPETKGAHCRIAAVRSETKNAQAKAITRIARESAFRLYPIWNGYDDAKVGVKKEMNARIQRWLYIMEKFQNAASSRYAVLNEH